MFVRDGRKDSVPVRPAKVRRRTQQSNRILLCAHILNHDIGHIVFLDLGSKIDADLNSVLRVLLLDRMQQRVEPLSRSKVTDHPCEVDLSQMSI